MLAWLTGVICALLTSCQNLGISGIPALDALIVSAVLYYVDMHRASSNQLNTESAPTDLLRDVLEPSASMLYNCNAEFDVLVDCPENLLVSRLRACVGLLSARTSASDLVASP